jgi:hypothetical protein
MEQLELTAALDDYYLFDAAEELGYAEVLIAPPGPDSLVDPPPVSPLDFDLTLLECQEVMMTETETDAPPKKDTSRRSRNFRRTMYKAATTRAESFKRSKVDFATLLEQHQRATRRYQAQRQAARENFEAAQRAQQSAFETRTKALEAKIDEALHKYSQEVNPLVLSRAKAPLQYGRP